MRKTINSYWYPNRLIWQEREGDVSAANEMPESEELDEKKIIAEINQQINGLHKIYKEYYGNDTDDTNQLVANAMKVFIKNPTVMYYNRVFSFVNTEISAIAIKMNKAAGMAEYYIEDTSDILLLTNFNKQLKELINDNKWMKNEKEEEEEGEKAMEDVEAKKVKIEGEVYTLNDLHDASIILQNLGVAGKNINDQIESDNYNPDDVLGKLQYLLGTIDHTVYLVQSLNDDDNDFRSFIIKRLDKFNDWVNGAIDKVRNKIDEVTTVEDMEELRTNILDINDIKMKFFGLENIKRNIEEMINFNRYNLSDVLDRLKNFKKFINDDLGDLKNITAYTPKKKSLIENLNNLNDWVDMRINKMKLDSNIDVKVKNKSQSKGQKKAMDRRARQVVAYRDMAVKTLSSSTSNPAPETSSYETEYDADIQSEAYTVWSDTTNNNFFYSQEVKLEKIKGEWVVRGNNRKWEDNYKLVLPSGEKQELKYNATQKYYYLPSQSNRVRYKKRLGKPDIAIAPQETDLYTPLAEVRDSVAQQKLLQLGRLENYYHSFTKSGRPDNLLFSKMSDGNLGKMQELFTLILTKITSLQRGFLTRDSRNLLNENKYFDRLDKLRKNISHSMFSISYYLNDSRSLLADTFSQNIISSRLDKAIGIIKI